MPLSYSRLLLVGILDKALILRFKTAHDALVTFVFQILYVLTALAYRLQRLVDSEPERMPYHPMTIAHAGHNVKAAVDSKGADRQLQLVSQRKGPTPEEAQVARKGTCTFGKNHQRHALAKDVASLVVRFADAGNTAAVDKYLVRITTGHANDRHTTQCTLHHPLEIPVQIAVNEEDIKGSLMIGHENIALSFLQILTPLDLDRQQENMRSDPRPQVARVITPEVAVANKTADSGDKSRQDGGKQKDRSGYENLIETINKFHDFDL